MCMNYERQLQKMQEENQKFQNLASNLQVELDQEKVKEKTYKLQVFFLHLMINNNNFFTNTSFASKQVVFTVLNQELRKYFFLSFSRRSFHIVDPLYDGSLN